MLGRDRDPFDRSVAYLRDRLAQWRPLQGAVISISGMAQTLDLSHTPVREALATLAGEGLIVRTASGYAGATFTPSVLSAHYDLAGLLVGKAVGALPATEALDLSEASSTDHGLGQIVEHAGDIALREAFRRVDGQLAPFQRATNRVLGDEARTLSHLVDAAADRRALAAIVRGHYGRRRRAAGRILAAAIGLGPSV